MPEDPVGNLCERVGETALRGLVARFYTHVPGDPVLGPMYPADDLAGAEERLADFLVMRCGGPARYAETRGHPRLRMRHAPFRVDPTAAQHWLQCMQRAFDAAPAEDFDTESRAQLETFLAEVARFLINTP